MLKYPRKEEGKKEKEMERRGKKAREEGKGKKKERKVKRYSGMGYWERRRKCEQRNEGA